MQMPLYFYIEDDIFDAGFRDSIIDWCYALFGGSRGQLRLTLFHMTYISLSSRRTLLAVITPAYRFVQATTPSTPLQNFALRHVADEIAAR